jgi:hypothetical protein
MGFDYYAQGKLIGFLIAGIIAIIIIFGGNFKQLFWVGIILGIVISLVVIILLTKRLFRKNFQPNNL